MVGEEGILTGMGSGNRGHKDTTWWGDYVVISLVEKAADEVLGKQEKKVGGAADRLYSLENFRKEFGSILGTEVLVEEDAMVLLKFLERDRKALVFDKDVRDHRYLTLSFSYWLLQVIKFRDYTSGVQEINVVDRGILELSNAVKNMHAQVDGIQLKMDQLSYDLSPFALKF